MGVFMKKLLVCIALVISGCSGSGGSSGGGASVAPPALPEVPVVAPDVDLPDPTAVSANKLSFVDVLASNISAKGGASIPLAFTINNPLANTATCNWWIELPPKPSVGGFAGIARHQEGTVNGPCTWTHNQTNQLDTNVWVYVSNGESTIEYQWTIIYNPSAVNIPVGIVTSTAAGTYRVFDTMKFSATVDDKDSDATCTWKVDGVTMNTSCVGYTYTQSGSATKTLVFRIEDSATNAQVSWTVKPAAKVSISPAVATGNQVFTATLLDPHSVGAICQFSLDGSIVQTGACTYSYTGTGIHTVEAKASYDSVLSDAAIAQVVLPANQTVSITGYTPAEQKKYFPKNTDTTEYKITNFTDADGDARIDWYVGGIKTDCDTSANCDYTNAQKTGMILKNLTRSTTVKATLTDGQYSSSKSWLAAIDTPVIDGNQPSGSVCNQANRMTGIILTFWVHGSEFELTDTWKLSTGEPLTVLRTYFDAVELRLTVDMPEQYRSIIVTKQSGISVQSPPLFVLFNNIWCT